MTDTQKINQCDGPGIPRADVLVAMLDTIPIHYSIRAVSIHGQRSIVIVEVMYEGLIWKMEFSTDEYMQKMGYKEYPAG